MMRTFGLWILSGVKRNGSEKRGAGSQNRASRDLLIQGQLILGHTLF